MSSGPTASFMVAGRSSSPRIVYSEDGMNWTGSLSGDAAFSGGICKTVAWNGTIWVAGGYGANYIATSSDGITWAGATSASSIFFSTCNSVAWDGTKWVAASAGEIAYSSNGKDWTESVSGRDIQWHGMGLCG